MPTGLLAVTHPTVQKPRLTREHPGKETATVFYIALSSGV